MSNKEKAFRDDLKQLLQKYNAELEVLITTGEWGVFIRSNIDVTLNSTYDENGKLKDSYENFELPNLINQSTL